MTQPTTSQDLTATPQPPSAAPIGPAEVSEEVRQFADQNRVAKYLPALLELAARVLPGRQLTVRLDWDPSIPDDGYITFLADPNDFSGEEWLAAYRAWQEGVLRICAPGDTHFFFFGV